MQLKIYKEAEREIEAQDPIAVPAIKQRFPELIELKMILHNNLMFALIKVEKNDEAIEEGLRAM